jgi:hypothetical protein
VIFQSRPSRTWASALHFQKQMSQNVGTTRVSPAAGLRAIARSPLLVAVATAAAPAPKPAIFRNRRREIRFMEAGLPATN